MKGLVSYKLGVVILLLGILGAAELRAQELDSVISPEFRASRELRGRVDFWKAMFTEYGKNHRVFHHRSHPEIIYSVLDFSEFEEKLSGKKLVRAKRREVDAETKRIRSALKRLAAGKSAGSSFERRLEALFTQLPGNRIKNYKAATDRKQIRYQQGVKERFEQGLVRSGRYLYAIEEIFRIEGLPIELGRLPLVESSFDYGAYSSAGAAGIWQFIRSTGRRYLRINAAIDERRDPILATRAAAAYLKHAYKKLGSWPLAITSYNHGLSGMMRAKKQVGTDDPAVIIRKYKSKTFGFASSNFYCEFIAALEVERDTERYFPGLVREPPQLFEEIRLGRSIYFRDFVKYSGTPKDKVTNLNLSFRSPVLKNRVRIPKKFLVKVPPGKGHHVIASVPNSSQLPLSGAAVMAASLRQPGTRPTGKVYKVRRGDTLGGIAHRHRVPMEELMMANNIRNPKYVRSGQKLVIPGYGGASAASRKKSPQKKSSQTGTKKTYRVRSGDTIDGIASKFSLSRKTLMKANNLSNPNHIRVGQKLHIPGRRGGSQVVGDTPRKNTRKTARSYTVVSGDNLTLIAKKTGTSVSKLKKLNRSAGNRIYPGQKLRLE